MGTDSDVQFDRAKFLDVVHYICARCQPTELGRVKLHKILYFADMINFVATGMPLTGAEYQKQAFGPVAIHLQGALRQLEAADRVEIRIRDYFGYRKHDFVARLEPDLARLAEHERQLIDDVTDFVCARSAREISEFSHNAVWQLAEIGERLPYPTAFNILPAEITDKDVEWGENEARRLVAAV